MRLYISWYPDPPDPSYWKWFRIDGLLVSLYNFRRSLLRKVSTIGLHKFTTFRGEILLDSGSLAFSRKIPKFTQTEVLSLHQ
jgi:queuine/archaeosine tRNA-ribosyltransferase